MECLILSDSHGTERYWDEVIKRQIKAPDAIFFLGDGLRDARAADGVCSTLFALRGNCDLLAFGVPDAAEELTVALEGHRIFACHGHSYGVKGGLGRLLARGAELGCDVILFGHTHSPCLQIVSAGTRVGGRTLERPLYLFNPGSLREGSFGTLLLRGDTVLLSHGRLN